MTKRRKKKTKNSIDDIVNLVVENMVRANERRLAREVRRLRWENGKFFVKSIAVSFAVCAALLCAGSFVRALVDVCAEKVKPDSEPPKNEPFVQDVLPLQPDFSEEKKQPLQVTIHNLYFVNAVTDPHRPVRKNRFYLQQMSRKLS